MPRVGESFQPLFKQKLLRSRCAIPARPAFDTIRGLSKRVLFYDVISSWNSSRKVRMAGYAIQDSGFRRMSGIIATYRDGSGRSIEPDRSARLGATTLSSSGSIFPLVTQTILIPVLQVRLDPYGAPGMLGAARPMP